MKSGTYMNYIALNQNILKKPMIIGKGAKDGDSEIPIVTPEGIEVYMNGVHAMPEHAKPQDCYTIGKMTHPYAMVGMPGSSGELSYDFYTTEKEYLIVVRLALEASDEDESDPAVDLLALVKKDSLPSDIEGNEDDYYLITRAMMQCHFNSLFDVHESFDELDDWSFEGSALEAIVRYHFERKESQDDSETDTE